MIEFRCLYCNRPTPAGEAYHVRCELMALIALSASLMKQRRQRDQMQARRIHAKTRHLSLTDIRTINK